MDIARRYQQLIAEIKKHDQAYYVNAAPDISDFQYDQLYHDSSKSSAITLNLPGLILLLSV
jgi:NAD-dependent DNA ligase